MTDPVKTVSFRFSLVWTTPIQNTEENKNGKEGNEKQNCLVRCFRYANILLLKIPKLIYFCLLETQKCNLTKN